MNFDIYDTEIVEGVIVRKKAGTKAYQHIRKRKLMPLPGVTTLRRRIKHFRVDIGMIW